MCCTVLTSCGTAIKDNQKIDNSSKTQTYISKTITSKKEVTLPKETTTKVTKKPVVTTTTIQTTTPTTTQSPQTTTQYKPVYTTTKPTTKTYPRTITQQQTQQANYGMSFEATWYEGGEGTYGYSGRTLISGYSVASNYFTQGTIIQVSGSGLDGTYRVDDRGGMANNVIDFYYAYGCVPSNFRNLGRVNITAYVVG